MGCRDKLIRGRRRGELRSKGMGVDDRRGREAGRESGLRRTRDESVKEREREERRGNGRGRDTERAEDGRGCTERRNCKKNQDEMGKNYCLYNKTPKYHPV